MKPRNELDYKIDWQFYYDRFNKSKGVGVADLATAAIDNFLRSGVDTIFINKGYECCTASMDEFKAYSVY